MTTHPKRAFLSLRSLMVMCFVAALFAWLNSLERSDAPDEIAPGEPFNVEWGFPITYSSNMRERRQELDHVTYQPIREWEIDIFTGSVMVDRLLIDVAFAIATSVALALASERFVFSRMRRARDAQKAE